MSSKNAIPDAWDDDWVKVADKPEEKPADLAPKLTKAARRAQHVEQQKQLWDSAENPGRNLWLEAQGVVPLKQEYKAPITLLSRRPVIAQREGDGEDSEEERKKQREADFEDRQRRARVEREEKQRKYAEARERIMGSSTPASPANGSRESSQGRDNRKPRGRNNGGNKRIQSETSNQSPVGGSPSSSTLFDPEETSRRLPRAENGHFLRDDHPVRQPRGPDRGGFGFRNRGGKTSV